MDTDSATIAAALLKTIRLGTWRHDIQGWVELETGLRFVVNGFYSGSVDLLDYVSEKYRKQINDIWSEKVKALEKEKTNKDIILFLENSKKL